MMTILTANWNKLEDIRRPLYTFLFVYPFYQECRQWSKMAGEVTTHVRCDYTFHL